jgi:peptidoglycan/xylan/chitin deacetylase (PgdA/CDA1 family)
MHGDGSVRHFAYSAVRACGQGVESLTGRAGCFFTFHRAAPSEVWSTLPNRNFYLDLDFLDTLLGYLKDSGRKIVTVEEGLSLARDAKSGIGFVNFSVDDCYRDTYSEIVPLFRRHGVPVTLFVTTGIPDATMSMWGAGLEQIIRERDFVMLDGRRVGTKTLDEKVAVFQDIQRLWDGPEAREHYSHFCRDNGYDEEAIHEQHAITWEMLTELAADPLVEIGSHTVSHPRISSLSAEAAFAELCDSKARLQQKLGVRVENFAFPYGRTADCGPRDFALARKAGYASVATTRKGILRIGRDVYDLPRNTLNGAHRSVLAAELHLAGVTGVAARLLGRH